MPWKALLKLIAPRYPKEGRPVVSRTRWRRCAHSLSSAVVRLERPPMEEARYEIASLRRFARLPLLEAIPDETTMLHFRHLLDATVIHAPSSTRSSTGTHDPEMHQVKKGNQWFFELKAHIGAEYGSVWWIPWRQRQPTSQMSRKFMRCCMAGRRRCLVMPVTPMRPSARN